MQNETTESQRPTSQVFKEFITKHWDVSSKENINISPSAPYTAKRRTAISKIFPGERIIIPAGDLKQRSNDTDYHFRPNSCFSHLTGLGENQEPEAVLILEPTKIGEGDNGGNHIATLFFKPASGKETDEFYSNARYGEFWVGKRPTLEQLHKKHALKTQDLTHLANAIIFNLGTTETNTINCRLLRNVDLNVDALVDTARMNLKIDLEKADSLDEKLAQALSEIRLIKDDYEISQMRLAVEATIKGFQNVVKQLPQTINQTRGERIIEGTFNKTARIEGNDVGYNTIVASGTNATTLHWIHNNGPINSGDLILIDAGVEMESLYTADITRTLPVNGKFNPTQKKVYLAVLEAANAAFAIAKPGTQFSKLHKAAMEVLAHKLEQWGLLPVSATESLKPENQYHRRWMVHGTSHHLGIDVHDCAAAREQMYLEAQLQPGMIFTIEPGLYFKENDLSVPEEYRGIGIRIEDDVLVTENGVENLSAALPRTLEEIENWLKN